MTTGKWIRAGIVMAAGIAGLAWLVGSFASRNARSIRMTIMVPADAELGFGTAIVSGRTGVGAVGRIGDPTWGLPLEIRSGVRHRTWTPVVLAPSDVATSGSGSAVLRLSLDRSASLLTLAPAGAPPLVLRRDESDVWAGRTGAGTGGIRVNGDSVPPGGTVRARAGDVIAIGDVEARFGRFGRFRPAE